MITFKGIIIPGGKRQDGTYNVKIRITHKGVSRRIPTTMYITQGDLTRSGKIKNPDVIARCNELCERMRSCIADISPFDLETADVDWVVGRIRSRMSADNFRLDFFEWSDKYLQSKTEQTRVNYITALNAFERYLGRRRIDINAITRSMLLEFVDSVESEGRMYWNSSEERVMDSGREKGKGTASRHLMKLQHLFNAAKDRYNDEDAGRILIPRSPFQKIERKYPAPEGQKSLGVEGMQKVVDAVTDKRDVRIALDVFILSYGLMGANLADLWNASPVRGDWWIYQRQKTRTRRADKAEMRVRIPPEMRPYIERLRGTGRWWLNGLHPSGDKDDCTARVNRCLKQWARENGMPEFTFYAARHTWATLARKAGVEKATIDECLCHIGDYEMTDIYAERDWDVINDANAKALALLRFP